MERTRRPNINYPVEVREAVERIQAQGLYPTVQAIREAMDGGTNQKIIDTRNFLLECGAITITVARNQQRRLLHDPADGCHQVPKPEGHELRIAMHTERVQRELAAQATERHRRAMTEDEQQDQTARDRDNQRRRDNHRARGTKIGRP